jgi:hypothetical protein
MTQRVSYRNPNPFHYHRWEVHSCSSTANIEVIWSLYVCLSDDDALPASLLRDVTRRQDSG